MKTMPRVTIFLCCLSAGLMLLPPATIQSLYMSAEGDQPWGLISGHFVHADWSHLTWNIAALLILGSYIEAQSKTLLLMSLVGGMFAVNFIAASPLSDIQYYCGLSGLLNALLGVSLYLCWKRTHNPIVLLVAVASVFKIGLEILMGDSIFTDITVATFPLSHAAGILAAPLVVWVYLGLKQILLHHNFHEDTRT